MTASAKDASGGAGARRPAAPLTGIRVAVLVVFGLLYAYFLWQAIGNAIVLPRFLALDGGAALNGTGWAVIVLNIVAAPLCYLAAMLVGARRSTGMLALLLAAGLCLLSALTLTLVAAPAFLPVSDPVAALAGQMYSVG
jgi:hypothetical protein